MRELLTYLGTAIKRAVKGSADQQQLERLVKAPDTLSPWSFWALVGLVRHSNRQAWVADVVRNRLRTSPKDLAAYGSLAHPQELAPQGIVPGFIHWEYAFHDRGCCLTYRMTGEVIDVEFYDCTADYIDTGLYQQYLRSLKHPDLIEQRLIELHPSRTTIRLAIDELRRENLIEVLPEKDVFWLSDLVHPLTRLIEDFREAWIQPNRRLQAAIAVGDWLAASEFVADRSDEIAETVRRRAAKCRRDRFHQLMAHFHQPQLKNESLIALAELQTPQLDDVLRSILQDLPCSTTNVALGLIAQSGDPSWCGDVYRLFGRLDPNHEMPEPAVWLNCATFLLRHGHYAAEISRALTNARRQQLGEIALVALEHAPSQARTLFQRALRSQFAYSRNIAAAALAVLDEPWSRDELIAALRESTDAHQTAECQAALRHCRFNDARDAVIAWERQHSLRPGPKDVGSFGDSIATDSSLEYEMCALHDRIICLRGRVR